ncbi:MAG: EthD family reductase [Thermomicrobiales bacterium]|nr:EthD family reductase [Thermomicrobiales bacterium]
MIKLMGTAYKRDDFTTEEFFQYWIDVHAPISRQVPGLRGYVVNEVVRRLMGEMVTEAFVEQWYDDEAAFDATQGTPELAAAWEDVGKYARTDGTFWLLKEHVIIPPPTEPGYVKTMGTAYKRDDFTTEEFFAYWMDVHAPISSKAPGLKGYVVNEVVRRLQGELVSEAFVQQWYATQEDFEASRDTPEVKAAWADVANYARTDGTFWQVKEHVIIPRPSMA